MIVFDPDEGTTPKGWELTGNPKMALIIHDDDVWEDYILGGGLEGQYVVTNSVGRTLDNFRMIKNANEENILCAGTDQGGAPATGMLLEMLIASGIEKIVAFGTCGGLDNTTRRNTIIVPTGAFRDEGLSYHYLPDGEEVLQNPQNVEAMEEIFLESGIPFLKGKVWTTDAIFRETEGKIKMFRERGAVAVDMELAACLAVAEFRRYPKFAQFLISDDNVVDKSWRDRGDALQKDLSALLTVAVEILSRL